MYYEAKVKSTRIDEKTGKEKTFNDVYLLETNDILSAIMYLNKFLDETSANGIVKSVSEKKYEDVLMSEDGEVLDKFYVAKIRFEDIDSKMTSYSIIINANIIEDAKVECNKLCEEHSTCDAVTVSLSETKIVDFISEE